MKTPASDIARIKGLPVKNQTMAFQKTYQRLNGSRVKIEPILQIDDFHNDAFYWSYIVYHAAPGQEKFEDVTDQHLQGQAYATGQEILECQLELWERMKKPGS